MTGVKFKSANLNNICIITDNPIYWGPENYSDHLSWGGGSVYLNGKWTEIVKDEEIKISEYTAKFSKISDIKSVSFGCRVITLDQLKSLKIVYELDVYLKDYFPLLINNNIPIETIDKLIKELEK